MRASFIAALLCGAHVAHSHDPKCCVTWDDEKKGVKTHWVGSTCITRSDEFEAWAKETYTQGLAVGDSINEALNKAGQGITDWATGLAKYYEDQKKEQEKATAKVYPLGYPGADNPGTETQDLVDPDLHQGVDNPDTLNPSAEGGPQGIFIEPEKDHNNISDTTPNEEPGIYEKFLTSAEWAKGKVVSGYNKAIGVSNPAQVYQDNGSLVAGDGNQRGRESAGQLDDGEKERYKEVLDYLKHKLEEPSRDKGTLVTEGATEEEPGPGNAVVLGVLADLKRRILNSKFVEAGEVVYAISQQLANGDNEDGAKYINTLMSTLEMLRGGSFRFPDQAAGGNKASDYEGKALSSEALGYDEVASDLDDDVELGDDDEDGANEGVAGSGPRVSCACGDEYEKFRGPFANESVCKVLGEDKDRANVFDQLVSCLGNYPAKKMVATLGNVVNIYEAMAMSADGNKVTGPTTPEEAQEAAGPFVFKECLDIRFEECRGIEKPRKFAACRSFDELNEELSGCLGEYHPKETFDDKARRDAIVNIYTAMISKGKEIHFRDLGDSILDERDVLMELQHRDRREEALKKAREEVRPFVQEVCLGMRYDKSGIEKPGEVATWRSFDKLHEELSQCLEGNHPKETFDDKARGDGIVRIYMKLKSEFGEIQIPDLKRTQVAPSVQTLCLDMRDTWFKECASSAAPDEGACEAFFLREPCEEWLPDPQGEEGSAIPGQLGALGQACMKRQLTSHGAVKKAKMADISKDLDDGIKEKLELKNHSNQGEKKFDQRPTEFNDPALRGPITLPPQPLRGFVKGLGKGKGKGKQPTKDEKKLGPVGFRNDEKRKGTVKDEKHRTSENRLIIGGPLMIGKQNGQGPHAKNQRKFTKVDFGIHARTEKSRAYKVARRLLNQLRQMIRSVVSKESSGSPTIGRA